MNKLALTMLTILILTLTACSVSNTPQSASGQSNEPAEFELPMASKLVIGSFRLEETEFAITSEQAVELLPLWQVYQEISTSDTAAQEEVDALIEQIQETMGPEQMTAINKLNLTQQDVFIVMQEQGIQLGADLQGDGNQNNGDGFPGGGQGFPGGGFPGGGDPPGGGGPGGGPGQGLSPQQIATAQALRAENGDSNFRFNSIPIPLLEALIRFLQERAG